MNRTLVSALAASAAFFVLVVGGSAADSFQLRLVSQTNSTITLGWDPQPGYGYLFSMDDTLVSRTNDPTRTTVKFSKGASSYEVAVITKGATGTYPTAPPPPPPAACANGLDDDGDGKVDLADPGCSSASDTDETDPPPPPPAAACANGLDDDADGKVDYPNDPGCSSATDTDETDPVQPPPGNATVFLSQSGNDANGCTQAAPCRSFGRAYRVAQPGQTVEIGAGNYATQSVSPDPAKTSSTDVVFRPAAGASIFVDGLYRWGASHTTIDGAGGNLRIGGFEISDPASTSSRVTDITIRNADLRGDQSQVLNVDGLTLSHVQIGGVTWGGDALRFNDPVGTSGDTNDPANVLVEYSTISDVAWPNSGDHPDGIAMSAGHNVTFRGNRIWATGSQGLYLISELGGNIHDVTIENNMFGDCRTVGAYSNCVNSLILDIRAPGLANITVRNNSFAVGQQPMRVSGGTSGTNIQVYGNAGEGPGCESYASYAYNVWDDAKCSSSDLTANPLFVSNASGPGFDLHLQAGSPALGKGDPSRFPAVDFDGQARTSPPDAGADER